MPKTVHDPIYRELVSRLVQARLDANLTQQEVADRLGLPQSFVAKLEGCERRLDVVELMRLAAAIGFDPMPLLNASWKKVRRSA